MANYKDCKYFMQTSEGPYCKRWYVSRKYCFEPKEKEGADNENGNTNN